MGEMLINRREFESVSSLINPSISVQYYERGRDYIDENHVGYIKNVTIYGKPFKIILGKTNFRVSTNQKFSSIVYFNIYRVENLQVKEKIGIFETKPTELSDLIGTLDITNNIYDIDISKFRQPLFFKNFITKYFPEKNYEELKENRYRETPVAQQKRKRKNPMRVDGYNTPLDTNRTNFMGSSIMGTRAMGNTMQGPRGVESSAMGISSRWTDTGSDMTSVLNTRRGMTQRAIDVQVNDQGIQTSPMPSNTIGNDEDNEESGPLMTASRNLDDDDDVQEETLELSVNEISNIDAVEELQAKRYVESIDDNWIQRKFKNKGFELVTQDILGTSLFDVLESIFNIQNTRELLSDAITQEHLSRYMKVYANLKNGIEGIMNKQRQLAIDIKSLKGSDDETKQKRKQLRTILKNTKKKIDEKKAMLKKYDFMNSIKTEDDLKAYVKNPDFWGDSLAITLLESILYKQKVKFIVLLEDRNTQHKLNNIISCNNYNRIDVDSYRAIKPSSYIILSLNDTEYTLVRYNGRDRHKFSELPYILKRKMIDNCINVA